MQGSSLRIVPVKAAPPDAPVVSACQGRPREGQQPDEELGGSHEGLRSSYCCLDPVDTWFWRTPQ